MADDLYNRSTQFINGEFVPAHADGRIALIDPATEEVFGHTPDGDAVDVDAAVTAAGAALPAWSALAPRERGDLLRALAEAFEKRIETVSALVSTENGTPISLARAMQTMVPANYRYFAGLADAFEPEETRTTMTGDAVIVREPVGVVGAIVPWNGPQPLIAWKIGPALAAGCTVVIKPAAETGLDAYLLAESAVEAGFPAGVINVVTGGRETGAELVKHPGIAKIAFTGSTAAGRAIAEQCARDFKHVTLELGGKSAGILLDDVVLDDFAPFVMSACTPNTGQTCRALTRILAPRSRYDEVTEFLADTMKNIPLGDPRDAANFYGPLVNAAQRDRVENYLKLGKEEGARVVTGGGRPAGFDKGYYVEPTVFADVTNDMRIAREEIFGPVVVVLPYDTVDEAVEIANDSDYGLGGGVFSPDVEKATAVARRIVSGTVGVNSASFPMDAPFGGVKSSGMGRELGPTSLDPYLEYKTIFRAV
ncbi:MAG: aldehyde dehydrogenase [Gordonia sp. (in: high G+C Gram-positive bacteria)]|uniref:aldehyde dehydrogenase n=1 Tax=Gordonia sp. (in: high G+C Gram-positive bacteria) TaxID=84139 RepID=UPI0039E63F74